MPEPAYSASSADEAVAVPGADGSAAGRRPELFLVTTRTEGDRVVVTVRGEMCLDLDDSLQERLLHALADSVSGLDLDLGDVDFCDCTGLNALLRARREALAEGKTITVRAAAPAVERLLDLTGTGPLFTTQAEQDAGRDLGVEVVQLRRAMRTRPTIDLARGVLMASFGLSPDQAWDVLVHASQNTNTKLHRLAEHLVSAVQGEAPPEAVQQEVAAAVARLATENA
ncbi:ANTAR domain-containing protein [Streptomyces sp. enrichment culture]|uniref:ANTAR domain-containing protein n=1 Tax=Streptomyces sp. enrichment culture TaxID=1795815 RepID=UPI003F549F11